MIAVGGVYLGRNGRRYLGIYNYQHDIFNHSGGEAIIEVPTGNNNATNLIIAGFVGNDFSYNSYSPYTVSDGLLKVHSQNI